MNAAITKPKAQRCYIGLGSNLNSPLTQLQRAVVSLSKESGFELVKLSSIYKSTAIGPGNQPDYLNAVAELRCHIGPNEVLSALQALEQKQGRERGIRWEARTLDLDILLFGSETICSETLAVPHPEMCARNFVIYPLFELNPALILPDGRSLKSIYQQLSDDGLKRLYNVALDEPTRTNSTILE